MMDVQVCGTDTHQVFVELFPRYGLVIIEMENIASCTGNSSLKRDDLFSGPNNVVAEIIGC
jgi:hypothetical protein